MAAGQRLPGVRAVVTGGASGIGAAVVQRFTAEGASVLAADVEGGDVLVDVTSSASVEAASSAVGLVASAGQATYRASKAGVGMLMRALGFEGAPLGMRANSV